MEEASLEKRQVTVRGLTLGDGIPKICIPITAADRKELKAQAAQALAGPCDLVEWRCDYYKDVTEPAVLKEALALLRISLGDTPLLFTFRTKEEGGEGIITPEEYVRLNEHAAVSECVDLIDIELNRGRELAQSLIRSVQECNVKAVCSYHDFAGTPETEELIRILGSMQALGADITKAAVMPQTRADVLRLLWASVQMKEQYADRPFITMSMGRMGSISRLAGAFDGSAVTFATAGRASAPGQMEASVLAQVLPSLAE